MDVEVTAASDAAQSSWAEQKKSAEQIRNHDVYDNNNNVGHECPGETSLPSTPPQSPVNVSMELDQTEAPVQAVVNQLQKNKRSRRSMKSNNSLKSNNENYDCQKGTSSMKFTPERVSCLDSLPRSNLLTKRRTKKQKGRHTALESNDKDCDRPEDTSLVHVALPVTDPSPQATVEVCLKLKREMAQSCAEVSSQEKIERKEQNERLSGSENNCIDHYLQEGGGMPTPDVIIVKTEKDGNSVSEVSGMGSADVKDNSVILGEQNVFPKSANTSFMNKHDNNPENRRVKTYRRKIMKIKTYNRRNRKSFASIGNSLESISEDGMRDTLCHCSDGVHTAGLLDNKLDRALLGVHGTSAVMEDTLMEEASFNCKDGESASRDCMDRILDKNYCELSYVNDVSVPDVPEQQVELKNGGEHHKILITGQHMLHVNEDFDEPASYSEAKTSNNLSGCDPSCKHPEQVDVEIDPKMEGSPSSHLSVVKDDVDLDVIVKEGKHSQILSSSPERALINCSKKKLLILDVNGLLVDVVPYVRDGYKADVLISKKAVFKRPFCDDFLQFCFDRFDVGVWSSRTKRNLDGLIDFLMGDCRHKLLFCWDQSHCTNTGFTTIENKEKPLVLKELRKLWQKLEPNLPWEKGEYNESNTLLLDDSPYKALLNPVNTAIFPYTYQYRDVKDMSLGPGGDVRVYLEGLAAAENVQKYVKQHRFGQRAITESNPSWDFYRKIIEANALRPHDDAKSSLTCQL